MSSPCVFKLSVYVFVEDAQHRILLLQRSAGAKHFPSQWDLPGGKVDPGEAFDQALIREVTEETGLVVALTGLAGATQYEVDGQPIVALCMEARHIGGEVQLSEEHQSFAWMSWEAVSKKKLSENLRPFVQKYANQQTNDSQTM